MSKTFDGMAIDEWGGRFSGAFDLDEEQASRYSVDDVIVLVVRAQVKGANVKTTPQGDVKRVHVLGVEESIIPSTKLWKECMAELRPSKQGQLPLPANDTRGGAEGFEQSPVIEVEEIEDVLNHVEVAVIEPQTPPNLRAVADLLPKDEILREFLTQ